MKRRGGRSLKREETRRERILKRGETRRKEVKVMEKE